MLALWLRWLLLVCKFGGLDWGRRGRGFIVVQFALLEAVINMKRKQREVIDVCHVRPVVLLIPTRGFRATHASANGHRCRRNALLPWCQNPRFLPEQLD